MIENYIIKEYVNGKSISSLQKELKIPRRRIETILRKNNIKIRGGRKYIINNENLIKNIILDYSAGLSLKELNIKYQKSQNTIKNMLIRNGVYIEHRKTKLVNKGMKEDYFSVIDSEEKAYFLGLIITDGSNDGSRVRLFQHNQDRYILEKFSSEIGIKNIYKDGDVCSVEAYSSELAHDLERYGVIKNKTKYLTSIPLEKIPEEYLHHFWRGYFDGDGSISYSEAGKYRVSVCGYNYELIEQIRNYIDAKIEKETHNKIVMASCWTISWHRQEDIKNIYKYIYKDATIFLERKYKRYLNFLEYYNNKKHGKDMV